MVTNRDEKLRGPKFGDWVRGNYASEGNPIRDGMYVRTIRKTGRMNPGVFYELTDGNGKFWQFEAKNTTRLEHILDNPSSTAAVEAFAWIVHSGDDWITTDEVELDEALASGCKVTPLYAAPLAAEGEEYPEAAQVCAEAYQVVGALLDDLGIFATEAGVKILDNLSHHRLVHRDVLPWTTPPKPEQPGVEVME